MTQQSREASPAAGAGRLGNAPVSWGVYAPGVGNPPFRSVLDGIVEAGYTGTELGPSGYLPTRADELRDELASRGLALASSFVPLALEDPTARQGAVETCLEVGRLLAGFGVGELIVADDEDEGRKRIAGRVPTDGSAGWDDAAWREVADTLHAVARALRAELAMSVVVHHHAGTYVETPAEIQRLLADTDSDLVGLLVDTGHAVYGGGDPCRMLDLHGERVRYVHLKDASPVELERVRSSDVPMDEAWRRGVFCPLGDGVVDFHGVAERLRGLNFGGWMIVEQDVVRRDDGRLVPDPQACARKSREFVRQRFGV